VIVAEPKGADSLLTNGTHQIRIDHMEPTTFEQFLYFIYTGESMGTFANEELLELADDYQLKTLAVCAELHLSHGSSAVQVSLYRNQFKLQIS
jgi:hypothetical protein